MPLDLRDIEREVLAGLPNEGGRLGEATDCRNFYLGEFDGYAATSPEGYEPYRFQRQTAFLQWVVNALTRNLYRTGPTRSMPDHRPVGDWLSRLYGRWWIDSAWQEADRAATWGGFAAFQVIGTEDPDEPLRYYLWDASELAVWLDPDDPRTPAAVATIDRYDNTRRLRLWTAETLVTFQTPKWDGSTSGFTAFRRVGEVVNPYGVVPFAFAHFAAPTSRFTTNSPGPHLRRVNEWLNGSLTETGDSIRYDVRPVTLAYGVYPGWTPPLLRPGLIVDVPAGERDAGGNGADPRLEKLQADAGYVGVIWEDLSEFIGHTLETHGVPRAAFRMEQSSVKSGIALVAEQVPLLDWAESRQRPFARYEESLARLCCTVAARHLANNGVRALDGVTVAALEAAAAAPNLNLRWGRMWANLPGSERDAADGWRLDRGLASPVDILMEREGLDRDEALAKIRQVAEDANLIAGLRPQPAAPTTQPKPPAPAPGEGAGEVEGGETFQEIRAEPGEE